MLIDHNAFIGEWPFYKLPRCTFSDLREIHNSLGISGGYVSSIKSIFYNDPYESEAELSETLSGTQYKHVVTANPAMAECPLTLARCISDFDVRGIRIHTGYHGYNINSPVLVPVLDVCKKHGLVLFVTARMHDERLTHMIHPELIDTEDLKKFLSDNRDIKILLCNFKIDEINSIREELFTFDNVLTDVACFRGCLYGDSPRELYKKAVFGTDFPLYPVSVPLIMAEKELTDEKFREEYLARTI